MVIKFTQSRLFVILFAIGITLFSACDPVINKPTSDPSNHSSSISEDCQEVREPTEADIKYALSFTGNNFQSEEWQRRYSVESDRVAVTWTNDTEGGLSYLEYLLYNCGYTQDDVDEYFSDESLINVILQNYGNPEQVASCTGGRGLKLHEFTAQMYGQEYLLRLWIKQVSSTRLLYLLMAFPENFDWSLDKYSQALFPSLRSC